MTDDTITWLVISFAVMGVAAAIAAILKTPREQWYRVTPPAPLEEQLKTLPASAQAVIIKGDKRRALIKSAPYILIGIILAIFSIWSNNTSHPECVRLLGINPSYISLLLFCYGLPIGFLGASLADLVTGIKTVKTGRYPPLDSVVFRDTISRKGALSTFRGITLLALPIFALFMVYLGNNTYTAVADGRNMHEIVEKLEAKCQ